MWCSRLSPVIQRSTNGHNASSVNNTVSPPTPGMNTFQLQVVWPMCHSQLGMMRTKPSAKPMYQSG